MIAVQAKTIGEHQAGGAVTSDMELVAALRHGGDVGR
jgi:hypothetical protein